MEDFSRFCLGYGVKINTSKNKERKKSHTLFKGSIYMKDSVMERVPELDYLGIRLSDFHICPSPQLIKSQLLLNHGAAAYLKFANRTTIYSVSPAVDIYRTKDKSADLYGLSPRGTV